MTASGVGYLAREFDYEVNCRVIEMLSPFADRLYVRTRLKESGMKTVMFSNIMAREIFQCAILDLKRERKLRRTCITNENTHPTSRMSSPWNINRANRTILSPKHIEKIVLARVEWSWPLSSCVGLAFVVVG